MRTFQQELVEWRIDMDLTPEQLSVLLGVPARTIQGWENGRSPRHPSVLRRALRDVARELPTRVKNS